MERGIPGSLAENWHRKWAFCIWSSKFCVVARLSRDGSPPYFWSNLCCDFGAGGKSQGCSWLTRFSWSFAKTMFVWLLNAQNSLTLSCAGTVLLTAVLRERQGGAAQCAVAVRDGTCRCLYWLKDACTKQESVNNCPAETQTSFSWTKKVHSQTELLIRCFKARTCWVSTSLYGLSLKRRLKRDKEIQLQKTYICRKTSCF